MEPALRHGDVLWVRKADFLPGFSELSVSTLEGRRQDETDRARVVRNEEMATGEYTSIWFGQPPLVLSGQVVVVADPSSGLPATKQARRVVGVGGQIVSNWECS